MFSLFAMNIKDLMKDAKDLLDDEFERRLNKLVRDNYRYANLNEENKKIVLDLVKKYKPRLRRGLGLSLAEVRSERLRLYQQRLELGLTEEDLKDIREILEILKK